MLLELLYMLTWRDIKLKYKQSVMGMLWAVLMPALIVGAGMLIRVAMSRLSGAGVTLESLAAVSVKSLPWAFFIGALRFATNSLASNANLITKINCPRVVFPLSSVLSALFDMMVAIVPLAMVLAWCGVRPGLNAFWSIPLLLVLVTLVTALGIGLAAANLFFRDVKYLVEVLLTFAIFFTPVFYDASMLGAWEKWILLNPAAPLLEGLQASIVLDAHPDPGWTAYSAVASLLLFAAAWAGFHRLEPTFAENV